MTAAVPGTPAPIRLLDLAAQRRRLGPRLDAALAAVLDHGRFVMGPEVGELEARLAARAGATHAVSCSSGTDALLLVLLAWGVGPGDAVVVPAFTFAATAEVVALLGAVPVFADVDPATFTVDPSSVDTAAGAAREAGLRPCAVVAVDLYGHPAAYEALGAVAEAHGLRLLADSAQSFGAERNGRPVGSLAEATATSFFPAKPLGCFGDGGAVFTDNTELARVLASLRVHGQGVGRYENLRVGINGRLDTIQAAVLLAKLEIFDDELAARRRIAAAYGQALAGVVAVPEEAPGVRSAWAQYTIRLPGRDAVAAALVEAGVPTAVYYPAPLHRQPAYRDRCLVPGGLPVAEALCGEVLSLPMHPYLAGEQVERVIRSVREAAGRVAGGAGARR